MSASTTRLGGERFLPGFQRDGHARDLLRKGC